MRHGLRLASRCLQYDALLGSTAAQMIFAVGATAVVLPVIVPQTFLHDIMSAACYDMSHMFKPQP